MEGWKAGGVGKRCVAARVESESGNFTHIFLLVLVAHLFVISCIKKRTLKKGGF